jgi:hypothetical protein
LILWHYQACYSRQAADLSGGRRRLPGFDPLVVNEIRTAGFYGYSIHRKTHAVG